MKDTTISTSGQLSFQDFEEAIAIKKSWFSRHIHYMMAIFFGGAFIIYKSGLTIRSLIIAGIGIGFVLVVLYFSDKNDNKRSFNQCDFFQHPTDGQITSSRIVLKSKFITVDFTLSEITRLITSNQIILITYGQNESVILSRSMFHSPEDWLQTLEWLNAHTTLPAT